MLGQGESYGHAETRRRDARSSAEGGVAKSDSKTSGRMLALFIGHRNLGPRNPHATIYKSTLHMPCNTWQFIQWFNPNAFLARHEIADSTAILAERR